MTSPPVPPPGGAAGPPPQPDKSKLVEAYQRVLDDARARDAEARAPAPAVRRGPKPALAAVLALACIAAWGLAPLRDLPTYADPPEVRSAGLRVALYIVAKRVEGWRQANGRLPAAFSEVGQTPDGIRYRLLDSAGYELVAVGRSDTLTYRSTQPLDAFLGNATSYFRTPSGSR